MDLVRKPVVAGSFYQENEIDLKSNLLSYLDNAVVEKHYSDALGVIAPHAGYLYSGQCAAFSYKALMQKNFKTAIIIAPSHHFNHFKFSIGNYDFYETPLGSIKVNKEVSEELLSQPDFEFIIEAHKYEHSLEVQLPFLQTIKPQIEIVPIIFGNQSLENSYVLADVLSKIFLENPDDFVFVISSDLSHYYSSDIALRKDLRLSELLKKRSAEELWQNFLSGNIEACGIGGILTLIILSNILNYNNVSNLKYYHSGEINHDFSKVVGYLSSIFFNK